MADTGKSCKRFVLRVDKNDAEYNLPTLDLSRVRRCKVLKAIYRSVSDASSLMTVSLGQNFDQTWIVPSSGQTPKLVFFSLPMHESQNGARIAWTANEGLLNYTDSVFSSFQSYQTISVYIEEDGVKVSDAHLSTNPLFLELVFS